MTLNLNLPPEIEERLLRESVRQGLAADAITVNLLNEHLPASMDDVRVSAWDALQSTLSECNVAITGDMEVRGYLDGHSDLFGVMGKVAETARHEFGDSASLGLKVYRDPECDDEYLALVVRMKSYTVDLLPRLRSVLAAHEMQLEDTTGSIVVTTDFHPM